MKIRGAGALLVALALAGCGATTEPAAVTVTQTATVTVTAEPTQAVSAETSDAAEVEMMRDQFQQQAPVDQESLCRMWTADLVGAHERLRQSGTDVSAASFEEFVDRVC